MREGGNLEDLDVNGRIMLNGCSRSGIGRHGLGWSGPG
jgi:hypothetical protein